MWRDKRFDVVVRNTLKKFLPESWLPEQIVKQWIVQETNGHVYAGPFAGMRYIQESVGSHYYPKILGTYELELAPLIEEFLNKDFDLFVNIGAAEGYYAVGIAWRKPSVSVIAFETVERGQELIHELAKINGVGDWLKVRGLCDRRELKRVLEGQNNSCLIVDIEGAEIDLLVPDQVPSLEHTTLLVEIHYFVNQQIEKILRERFDKTHEIRAIPATPRQIQDFPITKKAWVKILPEIYFNIPMGERPAHMAWLYLKPKISAEQ